MSEAVAVSLCGAYSRVFGVAHCAAHAQDSLGCGAWSRTVNTARGPRKHALCISRYLVSPGLSSLIRTGVANVVAACLYAGGPLDARQLTTGVLTLTHVEALSVLVRALS